MFPRKNRKFSRSSHDADAAGELASPEPAAPSVNTHVDSAAGEADAGRALASLIPDGEVSRHALDARNRFRAAQELIAKEGGARSHGHDATSPRAPRMNFTVVSENNAQRTPDVIIRFSRCESTPEGVLFEIQGVEAPLVQVAGDFNDWKPESMIRESSSPGLWRLIKPLPRGEYRYKFMVNGQWMNDPLNPFRKPNPFGGTDSIVRVSIGP